jgi:translation initiation factor IF-3
MTIRSPHRAGPRKDNGPKINTAITAAEVRVLDEEGEMRGVMSVAEGIALAEEVGLDLVELSPNAEPPVCKILDYSKYKFQQQKKAAEARKKQKTVDVKEVKIRPGIEQHDYDVKMRNARRFLEAGNKVKVTMRFRGREMAHQNIGFDLLKKMQEELADVGKTDLQPKMEGRQIIMVLSSEVGK